MASKTISIGFKFEQGADGFQKLTMDAAEFKKMMQGNLTEAEKFQKKLKDIGFAQLGIDSVKQMASVMGDLSKAFAVQVEAETKLETVMRQRMKSTEEDIKSIKDYCSAQQEIGIIGDEVQLAGVQQMATFLNQRDALETLIPAMNNLVAQQRGFEASAGDCVSIANLLGKAMIGDVMALKEVGITFTEAEKKAVQYGTEQERAAALAQIITNNVGNMNAELAKTDAGKAKQVENAMGDLKEQVGSVVAGMQPVIEKFNALVEAGANVGTVINVLRGMPAAFNAIKSAVSVSVGYVQGLIAKMQALAASSRVAAVAMKTAFIASGVGLAIWGICAAISALSGEMEGLGSETDNTFDAMSRLKDMRKEAAQKAQEEMETVKRLLEVAHDETRSKEDQAKAYKRLNDIIPDFNAHLDKTTGKYKENTKALDAYNKALKKKYELEGAKEIYKELGKKRAEAVLAEKKALEDLEKRKAEKKYLGRDLKGNVITEEMGGASTLFKQTNADAQITIAQKAAERATAAVKAVDAEFEALDKAFSKSLQDEALNNAGTVLEPDKKDTKPGKNTTSNQEPPPPEGSLKWMEAEISKLEAKLKITLNTKEQAQIQEQIGALKDKIEATKAKIYLEMRGGAEWEKYITKIEDYFKAKPITINGELKVDKDSLQAKIKPVAPVISKSITDATEDNKEFNQTLSEAGNLASSLGSAFASIGEMEDDPKAKVAGIVATTIANIMGSFASALAQSSTLGPFGWAAFGAAGLAQALSMASQIKSVTAFANGGIVSGPTMALVGEYAGASNNPEVIAPLNKLRDLLPDPQSGVQRVVVEGRIKGSDLELVMGNRRRVASMSGRKY